MEVLVVYVPNLLRCLGQGWSEDQLLTGCACAALRAPRRRD
jgi:hypothetical protein